MRWFHVLLLVAVATPALAAASRVRQQADDASSLTPAAQLPSQQALRDRIQILKASETGEVEVSIRQLEQAIGLLDEVDAETKQMAAIRAEISAVPEAMSAAESKLESIRAAAGQLDAQVAAAASESVGELQDRVEEAQDRLFDSRRALAQVRASELRRIERTSELATAMDRAKADALEATDRAAAALKSDPGLENPATVLAVASEAKAIAAREYLRILPERIIASSELDAIRLEIAEESNRLAERAWRAWTELLFSRLASDAEKATSLVSQNLERYGDAADIVAEVANANKTLLEESRTQRTDAAASVNRTSELLRRADALDRLLTIETQQLMLGGSRAMGEPLRRELAEIGQIEALKRELAELRRQALELYLRELELGQELAGLSSPKREAQRRLVALPKTVSDPEAAEAAIADLLTTQRDLLIRPLLIEIREHLSAIDEQARAVSAMSEAATRFRHFLIANLLSLRTGPWIGPREILASLDVRTAVPPDTLGRLGRSLKESQAEFPARWLLSSAAWLLIFASRPRLRRALFATGQSIRRIATDHFVATISALGLTLLLAAPLPLALLLLGAGLKSGAGIDSFVLVIGDSLAYVAMPVGLLSLLAAATIPGGLADAHFRWRQERLNRFRRGLGWLTALTLVFYAAALLLLVGAGLASTAGSEELGRLCLIGWAVAAAVYSARAFNISAAVRGGRSEIGFLTRLVSITLVAAPLTAAVFAWLGYSFASYQIMVLLFRSAWIVLGTILIRDLLIRWLSSASRQIAREQLERQRAEAASGDDAVNTAGDLAETAEDPSVDLAKVNAQAYRVIQSLFVTSTGIWLALAWSGLLPAFSGLSEVVVWETMTEVASSSGDGTVSVLSPVSVLDLAGAVLIMALTVVLTRDIPGLLQLLVLPRLPVSAGVGYAATSFVRYGIGVVGVLIAFSMLGLRWNQVQWLASAAVLGLSFGLQEIFSNFVSGILMLLEQPVRVGDVVTVSGVTGRVNRIQIRATTITDWDRRELVIPNKSFITGQFTNWTLSDNRTRQIIEIGVAYGSDYRKVEQVLIEAATGDPDVSTDPAPSVVLKTFGDSSVNFDLRFVIDDVSKLPAPVHRIRMRITELFDEHGIEIPFPQRDLHLKSVAAPAAEAMRGG